MTVRELVRLLEDYDPHTEIVIINSSNGERQDDFRVYDNFDIEDGLEKPVVELVF